MTTRTCVAILAGGRGTRFWPLSRRKTPKQFLPLLDPERSMIQVTADRIQQAISPDELIVVTGEEYETLTKEQLPNAHVLAEPIGRNTAPGICLAALHCHETDPNSVLVVLPADHSIKAEGVFAELLQKAVSFAAESQKLVTLGIAPSMPHTGYGYIRAAREELSSDVFPIEEFVEKPDEERARGYLDSGNYLWNSGMFVLPTSVLISELEKHSPEILESVKEFYRSRSSMDGEQRKACFSAAPALPIDIAVFEKTAEGAVIRADGLEWSDVGEWSAWGEHQLQDSDGNRFDGDFFALESRNCIGKSTSRKVALLGVEGLVIVDTPELLMVCPSERSQEVKKLITEETE